LPAELSAKTKSGSDSFDWPEAAKSARLDQRTNFPTARAIFFIVIWHSMARKMAKSSPFEGKISVRALLLTEASANWQQIADQSAEWAGDSKSGRRQ
jgi:hypothetical protein